MTLTAEPTTPMAVASTPQGDGLLPLDPARLRRAKPAYTTRHLDLTVAAQLLVQGTPRVGDVVLARVTEIGQHARVELPSGRRALLFPGDEVVVAYGHRYAPDQFEAAVPDDLGPCELVAAGGIAARVSVAHGKMSAATALEPVGLLADASGRRLTLADGVPASAMLGDDVDRPLTIAVVGASMNAGKTTTAAHLVRGLRGAGLRVGAAKTTGTGAGGDVWLLSDAGAFPVYDFTSAGLPSTYRVDAERVRGVFCELTDRLAQDGCEAIVIEVADGVYQDETAGLLVDPLFLDRVDAVLFASYDALGATAGIQWLQERGISALALSGVLSSSPLATREAETATGKPVWGLERLSDPDVARELAADLRAGRPVRLPAEEPNPGVEDDLARMSSAVAVADPDSGQVA